MRRPRGGGREDAGVTQEMKEASMLGSFRIPSLVVAIVALAVGVCGPAAGQDEDAPPVPADTAAAPATGASAGARATGGHGQSFGAAFFRSMRTVPGSNEKELEILGSVIIWFLLALSMLSIGLIGYMALTNQRKSILPAGVVAETRTLLETGKYADVLNMTRQEPSLST